MFIPGVIGEIAVALELPPRPRNLPCKVAFLSGNSQSFGERWERGQGTRPHRVVGLVFLRAGARQVLALCGKEVPCPTTRVMPLWALSSGPLQGEMWWVYVESLSFLV